MKKYRLSVVLFVLLISTFLLSVLTIEALASSNTLDFTFEKDVLYSESNPIYDSAFNIRNQTTFTGNYPATYSFENETNGTNGTDIDFIDSETITIEGGDVYIVDSLDNHNKILYGNPLTSYDTLSNTFEHSIIKGEIEFWLYITSNSKTVRITLTANTGNALIIYFFSNGQIKNFGHTTGLVQIGSLTWIKEKWYHCKIDFNVTSHTYDFFFNGILAEADLEMFSVAPSYMLTLNIGSDASNYVSFYIDAIGYSWDGYNATYSFTDDTDGVIANDWVDDSTGDCNATVFPSFYGHYKVLKLEDRQAGYHAGAYNTISNQENGTIEFWIAREGTDAHGNPMLTLSDATPATNVLCTAGKFALYYGGSVHFATVDFLVNQWYHIRTDFDCSDNSVNLTIDGDLEVEGEFQNTVDYINKIQILTDNTKDDYSYLIDAVGYSWDVYYNIGDNLICYNIGDNIIPLIETNTSIQEVNRFEFLIDDYGEDWFAYYDTGDDNPSGWTDIEGGGGDDVNCRKTYNGTVEIKNEGDYDLGTGIKKQDFELTSKRINITIGFELIDMDSIVSSHFDLYVNSSDNTEVIRIYIDKDGDLGYYDDSDDKVVLDTGLLENVYYEYNLFVHYEYGSCFFRYSADGVFVDSYVFPLKETGKKGLKGIITMLECSTTGHQVDLIYIGVYSNGNTAINDFAYIDINISKDWSYPYGQYFFDDLVLLKTLVRSNKSALYMISYNPVYQSNMKCIYSEGVHITEHVMNLFGFVFYDNEQYCLDPGLRFVFKENITVDIFDISLEGSMLSENGNNYLLEYSFGGINVQESYFYVDVSNKLQFNLVANDDNLEYIQAVFEIQNIATENRSIRFYSNIDGNSKGYFALDYESATSSTIEFPYSARGTNVILTQTESIENFTILITDNDLDNDDTCEGYITGISLIYYPDLATTITSLNLLAIIVPLIILIAPPLALEKKFGSKVILPMFILMAIICVATKLIPVWLFFIIVFGSIGFIFMKDRIEVGE